MTETEIAQTWQEWYPKVYGYFFRRIEDQMAVEELTATVMEAFIMKQATSDQNISFPKAYMWRICHNALASYIRDKSKSVIDNVDLEICEPIDQSIENYRSEWYSSKVKELINCAQKSVSSEEFEIIELSILDDKKSHDVAQTLGINAGTVRQKLSRALAKIRDKCLYLWDSYRTTSHS
jgi:RNA polymerase sigma factor (sigma-70 family)